MNLILANKHGIWPLMECSPSSGIQMGPGLNTIEIQLVTNVLTRKEMHDVL